MPADIAHPVTSPQTPLGPFGPQRQIFVIQTSGAISVDTVNMQPVYTALYCTVPPDEILVHSYSIYAVAVGRFKKKRKVDESQAVQRSSGLLTSL